MRLRRRLQLRMMPVALLVLVLAGLTLAHADMEEVVFSFSTATDQQWEPEPFPHELHMDEIECLSCHHEYKDGENVLDEDTLEEGNPEIKCGFCHNDKSRIDLQSALHRQCAGCHNGAKSDGASAYPEMCSSCHPSKKKIPINNSIGSPPQRPVVKFTHETHMETIECVACHHQYGDETGSEEEYSEIKCGFCHTDKSSLDSQTAFHRQCMGCHIKARKAKEATGPEMCGGCHVRSE